MLVRRMTLKDIDAAAQIETACFSQPWSKQSFQESLTREDTIFLVCEITAEDTRVCESMELSEQMEYGASVTEPSIFVPKIAGYMGMYLSFEEASITNVAVLPECRKRGIGELLVAEAKRSAIEAGIRQILLEVRLSNDAAISLYKKMGFVELGIRKKFYEHPVEDAYIMSCALVAAE